MMAEVKWKKGFREMLSTNGSVLRWYHKGKLIAKSCRICGRVLEPSDFTVCNKNPDKLNYICRECVKIKRDSAKNMEYQTRYRKSSMHRELHRLYVRDRYWAGRIKGKGINYIPKMKGVNKDDKEMYN